MAGIVLADHFKLPTYLLLSLLILFLISSIAFLTPSRKLASLLLLMSLLFAGMWRYESVTSDFPWNHITSFVNLERTITLTGQIAPDPDMRADRTSLTVAAESLFWQRKRIAVTGKVLVKIRHPSARFNYGDIVSVRGHLFSPLGRRNPGAFDYQRYLNTKDIHGQITVSQDEQVQVIGSGGNIVQKKIISPARSYLIRHFNQTLAEPYNYFLAGFVLGEKREMPEDLREKFTRTGTLHLMAVSGSNVGLVLLFAYIVSALLRFPRRLKFTFLAATIIFFALLTDLQPSVVRASVMALLALVAFYTQRDVNFLNLVSLTALLILIYDPRALFEVSFQLSFAATLGIGLLVPQMGKIYDLIFQHRPGLFYRGLVLPFFVSVAAILGVAPLQIYYFHNFPLIGFLSNLVVVPLVGASIILASLSALFSLLWFPLSQVLVASNWLILKLTLLSVDFFGDLPFALVKAPHPPSWAFWIYPIILLLIFYAPQFRRVRRGLILTLAVTLALALGHKLRTANDQKVKITVLDVGPAQAILFELPESKRLLWIQESASTSYNYLDWTVLPFIYYKGIGSLDRLIVSATKQRVCLLTADLRANLSVRQALTTVKSDSLHCKEDFIRYLSEEPLGWEEVKLFRIPPDNRTEPKGFIFEFKEFTFLVLNRLDSLYFAYDSKNKPVIGCLSYGIFKGIRKSDLPDIKMDQIIISGWDFRTTKRVEQNLLKNFPGRKIWWTKNSGAIRIDCQNREFQFKPVLED